MGQVIAVFGIVALVVAVAGIWAIPGLWRYSEKKYMTYVYIGIYSLPFLLAGLAVGAFKGNALLVVGSLACLCGAGVLLYLAITNRRTEEEAVEKT